VEENKTLYTIKLKTEIRHNPVIGSENNYETIKIENRCKASGMQI